MTETALFADVILPASAFPEKTGTVTNTDRRVQLGRQALKPPGDARLDLWIIQDIAQRIGLDWHYEEVSDVFDEMRKCMDSIKGISWERLEQTGSVTYPCADAEDPGQPILFKEKFPTENGLALFVPAKFTHADEIPDQQYPFIFINRSPIRALAYRSNDATGKRVKCHRTAPGRLRTSRRFAEINARAGDTIRLTSKRGTVECLARSDRGLMRGQIFMPFCYNEAAANLLTNEALDPYGKIPEFKFCALKLEKIESPLAS